ncbi:MAG TPA: ATP-binding protein, partial [Opitutus sp.]|nr:ATP-binding protein [Opitutus sp.]
MPPLPTIPTCTGEVHPVNGVAPDRVRRDDEPGARATLPRRIARAARALGEKWRRLRQGRVRRARFDRRRQERAAELERDNAALRQQLERCAEVEKELTRARNSAEAADAAKSAFLATMSHEIRTSLNGVIGMANLLRSSELDADQREMAETVCRCGETLLTIINDILDFSKIEAGRLELEAIDFDLVEQLQLAVELQSEPAQKKGLELIVDVDPAVPAQVRGDPVRLRQIVLNLVSNAIKFTAHGEIVLRVRPDGAPAAGPRVRFEVIDTGIGIAPDVQAALFQPFAQAEASTTRRFGGTGLGLAICKRLAGLM